MRSGKEEERSMGPLFPRLHVNDTEKGGPRAPPRNKMALYEQLSIPSQRFNPSSASTMPLPSNNTMVSSASASMSQGGGHERAVFSPFYMPPSAPAHLAGELHSRSSDGVNLKTVIPCYDADPSDDVTCRTSNAMGNLASTAECSSLRPHNVSKPKSSYAKKFGDDEDFMVPTFSQYGIASYSTKEQNTKECEKLTPFIQGISTSKAASLTCSSSMQHHNPKCLKRPNTTDLRSRQHIREKNGDNPERSITSKDRVDNTIAHQSTREKIDEPLENHASLNKRQQNNPMDDLGRLDEVDVSNVRNELCIGGSLGNGHSLKEYCEGKNGSQQVGDTDKNDDVSETSMLDSISGLDISPDDVVGVIGQKHFWKARKAIVNQQRVFSVQVFELHRLIKVQKLFAGSPHLLLESHAYISNPSVKASAKELPSEFAIKSLPQTMKRKSDSLNPSRTVECIAENAVGKPSQPSVVDAVDREVATQRSSYGPYSESPAAAPVAADNKQNWCFPPPGNQWLVPVMSPSEGLIYKPFAGPCPPTAGFMAPIYGGCLPPPHYGPPASHPPGMGLLAASPVPQNYFPHYGVPVMNPVMSSSAVEQVNPFSRGPSHGQTEKVSNGEVNMNMNSRNSCNMSNQKSEAISRRLSKVQHSKESELQGSTASSPIDRAGTASESRDALPLFPTAPSEQSREPTPQPQSSDQQFTRVIKVVPHNPRSANESAARIFRSIQEERQQYD